MMINNLQEDSLLPISHHSVKLPLFEGPFDLLLFLIKKNELDIYDIPIDTVTRQYLDTLQALEHKNLELTGEFFVMAATLMLIKSRLLLPKPIQSAEDEDEQEPIDPRWELIEQLIHYKKIKEQAEALEKLISQANDLLPREFKNEPNLTETIKRPLKKPDKMELWYSFNKVLQKLAEKMVTSEIYDDKITVVDRMNFILKMIQTHPQFLFSSLFNNQKPSLHLIISSFLAVLELSRLNKLYLKQAQNFSDILCTSIEFSKGIKPLEVFSI